MYKGIAIHTHTSSSLDYLNTSLNRDFSADIVREITINEQTVPVVTLDSLRLAPDIIKIDVEGFDYEVLVGGAETISRCRPAVMLEYTPNKMGKFEDFFAERSYKLLIFDEQERAFRDFDHQEALAAWNRSGLQVNIFAVPSDRAALLPTVR